MHLQEVTEGNVASFTKTVKAAVILSRNLDNIPFIASCQLVTSCVSASTRILASIANKQTNVEADGIKCVVLVCLLLEGLYDPYFAYRKSLTNQSVDVSKIKYQPALLHVEVVPFIYGNQLWKKTNLFASLLLTKLPLFLTDCFQHSKASSIPVIAHALLYLFGAIMKGAQVRIPFYFAIGELSISNYFIFTA